MPSMRKKVKFRTVTPLAAKVAPFFNLEPLFVYELGEWRWDVEAE